MSCREEILDVINHHFPNAEFTPQEVIDIMLEAETEYSESTISTHITSRMCRDAPDHHAVTYDDLERVAMGRYRLLGPDVPIGTITQLEILRSGLQLEYLRFLQNIDNIEGWEDIIPLSQPLVVDKEYEPVEEDILVKLQNLAPQLREAYGSMQFGNHLASQLGIRYAYSRLDIHAHLLCALERFMPTCVDDITSIVEVGCFNGGLLHFLAEHYAPLPTIGVDLSPVALDISSDLSDAIGTNPKTLWLESNFSLFSREVLPEELQELFQSPLIILSNVLGDIGQDLSLSPAVDNFHAQAGLVSYWVNQGAIVLVVQRNDSIEEYFQILVKNGRWNGAECRALKMDIFRCWATENMSPDNPLGDWVNCNAGVFLFYNERIWPQLV